MTKKKEQKIEPQTIAPADALFKATDMLDLISSIASKKEDLETMFNVAAIWLDIYGRLAGADVPEVSSEGDKAGESKFLGFVPGKEPDDDDV